MVPVNRNVKRVPEKNPRFLQIMLHAALYKKLCPPVSLSLIPTTCSGMGRAKAHCYPGRTVDSTISQPHVLVEGKWMASFSHRRPINRRPRKVSDGQFFFAMPRSMIERRAEEALIVSFVSDRKLFGLAYWMVQPDYFDDMPVDSGVFVSPLVRTRDIISDASKPGDIDLLVIPYEGEELVLDRVLAIEVKAIRARFVQKGKSPNDFGFSQALALLELGFPYAAVAHLIVSDQSPEDYWTEVTRATVLDQHGALGEFIQTRIDTMPGELMDRSFGRLGANCATDNLGLISAYVSLPLFNGAGESQGHSIWHPTCRAATVNGKIRFDVLDRIAAYFQDNAERLLNNPRYDRVREQG